LAISFSSSILILSLISFSTTYASSGSKSDLAKTINNSSFSDQDIGTSGPKDMPSDVEKAVVIMFDRGSENQFTNAKPILDKYGFKASFFIICSYINGDGFYAVSAGKETFFDWDDSMSWRQIRQLDEEGHDVQSHGMEHRYLRNLSAEDLEYEIAESKECLEDEGVEPIYFQFPNNKGADNSTILKMVSKYFDFGLSDHSTLMFLNCDGWVNHGFKKQSYKHQIDCNPYAADGTLTRTHKYAIREWSHDREHSRVNDKNPLLEPHGAQISDLLFTEFVRIVESQYLYNNKAGKIVAIPIIGYHSITDSSDISTSIELFDREMKYLYDNGFKVLTLTDLGYNDKENHFYIK
jgi:hypothetical protein